MARRLIVVAAGSDPVDPYLFQRILDRFRVAGLGIPAGG
jgi:hypothetical protein